MGGSKTVALLLASLAAVLAVASAAAAVTHGDVLLYNSADSELVQVPRCTGSQRAQ
jgi:hypothetical protein